MEWDVKALVPAPYVTEAKTLDDKDLVREFLEFVADYSGQEIREMVPGVTDNDVSRWRRGDWTRITKAKRRAIKSFVEMRRVAGVGFWPAPANPGILRERGPSFEASGNAAEIIHALGDPEWIRRHAGLLTPCERGDFGYQIARRRNLEPDEMAKVIAWRNELCGDDAEDG